MSMEIPFAGLRVLDVSQGLAGPYCGSLLAQYGAQVVKLEPPEGDWARGIGVKHGSHSAIDLMANRGKQSIAVDLKNAQAITMVKRMAAQCDVMIESYRPGIAARLGIGYDDVARDNPRLIYLSVSGFGQEGEKSGLAATDTVMQGFSGMMALNPDPDGKPKRVGFLAVDTLTALYAFQAVSVALYARQRDAGGAGGKHLDINLMQATAAFLTQKIVEASLEGEAPKAINVPAGVYRTQDGWIAITLSKEAHYGALCRATGRADLAEDPRFASFVLRSAHGPYLEAELGIVIAGQTTAQWLEQFQAQGVVASRVNTLTDWLADPHVVAAQAAPMVHDASVGKFHFPQTPGIAAPAAGDRRASWPGVGSNGADVLAGFGFSPNEISELKAGGAFIQTT
jgi:crotonobetainyl-CoA:carnitine CoA-transferase CaiB-like acyl-CoA transferase